MPGGAWLVACNGGGGVRAHTSGPGGREKVSIIAMEKRPSLAAGHHHHPEIRMPLKRVSVKWLLRMYV
jgi:hypothetical protein